MEFFFFSIFVRICFPEMTSLIASEKQQEQLLALGFKVNSSGLRNDPH
jgi:hypothetical protein